MNETIEELVKRFVAALIRRPEKEHSERKTEALVWLAISGRTSHAIAHARGFSPDVLRQWMTEKQFRKELETLPDEFAAFVEECLRAQSRAPSLGIFDSAVRGKEFLGPAAATALARAVDRGKDSAEPRYWIAVQRLATESLGAEQAATDAKEGWVVKRGRNEEALNLFKHAGYDGHPLEWLEILARRHLFDCLKARGQSERAALEEIINALKHGDESRAARLRAFRAQLLMQKGRNRKRVSKWREQTKK